MWQDEDDQALRCVCRWAFLLLLSAKAVVAHCGYGFILPCRINVARETRLRKLRKNEGEEVGGGASSVSCLMGDGRGDIFNTYRPHLTAHQELRGDEYARRLRQQFSKVRSTPPCRLGNAQRGSLPKI